MLTRRRLRSMRDVRSHRRRAKAVSRHLSNALSAASIVIMSVVGRSSDKSGPRPGPGTTAEICSQTVSGVASFGSGGQNDGPSSWQVRIRSALAAGSARSRAVRQTDDTARGSPWPTCMMSRDHHVHGRPQAVVQLGDQLGRVGRLDRVVHRRHRRAEDDRRDRHRDEQLDEREASFARRRPRCRLHDDCDMAGLRKSPRCRSSACRPAPAALPRPGPDHPAVADAHAQPPEVRVRRRRWSGFR